MSRTLRTRCYRNEGNQGLLQRMPRPAGQILDVGCGAGDNARLLGRSGGVVDGITLSPEEARRARHHCRRVWIRDLEEGLPGDLRDRYDAVLCSHVLEHLRQPESLVRSLARLLRKTKGVLLVALPNPLFYQNRWNLLRGRCRYEETGLMDSTHLRWFTFATGRELLEKNGFRVLSASVEGSFPQGPLRKFLPQAVSRAIDQAACLRWPGLFGWQMIYVARPKT